MQKITPFLWFDKEAVHFYVSIFKNSKAGGLTHYGEGGPRPAGSVMTASFELFGQEFVALNGGPHFTFSEAISFVVNCETQGEVDEYWEKLSESGKTQQCGWLKDKYGLSWQIVPTVLPRMLKDKDPEKAKRVFNAIMKMVKIDIATLQRAYDAEQ